MVAHTKQRMITAAAESLRRHGLAGTSFTSVLAASGAARGAVYHHFPAGKVELVSDAVRQTDSGVQAALGALSHDASSPSEIIHAFLLNVRSVVLEAAQGAGCAVAAVATEATPGDALQLLTGTVLGNWRSILARQLISAGASPTRAEEIAALLITTLEGAHVLCRADGSIAPFDQAAHALRAAFPISETHD
jgi:TetR/AcrR family transcriptional repressor of lmrAB and yxaGH operons